MHIVISKQCAKYEGSSIERNFEKRKTSQFGLGVKNGPFGITEFA